MAELTCRTPHPLQGTKVLRTSVHDGAILRERVCSVCSIRIFTFENDKATLGARTKEREEHLRRAQADYKWAMQAIIDLSHALTEKTKAEEVINKLARGGE